MILTPEEIKTNTQELGPKTLNLKKLVDMGLNVPKFVAIPTSSVVDLWEEGKESGKVKIIAEKAAQLLKSNSYAVRSSSLNEDQTENSLAGQFITIINVKPENLAPAIFTVIKDASTRLSSLNLFSLIIQEYLPANFSGVTFTRNPQNGREMVVEYHKGAGENIVGGQVIPKRLEFYWNEQVFSELQNFTEAIEVFKRIEQTFKRPQDIEWCQKDGEFYFMQTRPISTIEPNVYKEFLFLDNNLPKNKKFFYEKTSLSEIAEKPTPFTLSLLEKIYSANGPAQKVYWERGIKYYPQDFIKTVGNELYVDKEKDLKTLYPAFSYLKDNFFQAKLAAPLSLLTTVINYYKLKYWPYNYEDLFTEIKSRIETPVAAFSLRDAVDKFLKDYELIFKINLVSAKVIKQLEPSLKKQKINLAKVLSEDSDSYNILIDNKNTSLYLGNSLEVADTSQFLSRLQSSKNNFTSLSQKFSGLLAKAQILNKLKEYGRWLAVKNVTEIRNSLYKLAEIKNFKNREDIFFFSIQELLSGHVYEEVGSARRIQYQTFLEFHLPPILTHSVRKQKNEGLPFGVSPGIAEGSLVDIETTKKGLAKPSILYTKILSPDLMSYFPNLVGVVSEKGGMLSHLAIMAREYGIPTIVNFNLSKSSVALGDKIKIDGSTGQIEKL